MLLDCGVDRLSFELLIKRCDQHIFRSQEFQVYRVLLALGVGLKVISAALKAQPKNRRIPGTETMTAIVLRKLLSNTRTDSSRVSVSLISSPSKIKLNHVWALGAFS